MNKKQVVKAEIKSRYGKKEEMYGIAINDSQVLLENTQVCDIGKQTIGEAIKVLYWGDGYKKPEQEKAEIKVSATRNVPPEIRKALEMGLVDYLELYKQLDVLEKTLDTMELFRRGLYEMSNDCREARGILTPKDFCEEFEKSLSPAVKTEMKRIGEIKTGYDCCEAPYTIGMHGSELEISREVDITKYYREENEMVYEEYDGCMLMYSDAENTKTYKNYISKYSNPLPVKSKCDEYLELGDKDYLIYNCVYRIPLDKPLTQEYAKKLAEDFCDPKKDLTKVKKAKGTERE